MAVSVRNERAAEGRPSPTRHPTDLPPSHKAAVGRTTDLTNYIRAKGAAATLAAAPARRR